jgi:hypothetical protein
MYTRRMTLAVVVALAALCAKHASAESTTDLAGRFPADQLPSEPFVMPGV